MLERDSFEIRSQPHLMDAEGTGDNQPTESEIIETLKLAGFHAFNISICYDNLMGFWRWSCDIRSVE